MMKPGIRARYFGVASRLGGWDFDSTTVRITGTVPTPATCIKPRWPGQVSFSLGVFRYVHGAGGKLKRGPVVRRIVGSFGEPGGAALSAADAFAAAIQLCNEREQEAA